MFHDEKISPLIKDQEFRDEMMIATERDGVISMLNVSFAYIISGIS